MNKLKLFFEENFDFVIKLSIGLFILYWFFYFLTPKTEMSDEDKRKLDLIIENINEIKEKQKQIDSSIFVVDKEIANVTDSIKQIKNKEIIIKEIYHEKINSIREFDDVQLDSFFTERYGYNPR